MSRSLDRGPPIGERGGQGVPPPPQRVRRQRAAENVYQVSDRGRIPGEIVEAYRAAH